MTCAYWGEVGKVSKSVATRVSQTIIETEKTKIGGIDDNRKDDGRIRSLSEFVVYVLK